MKLNKVIYSVILASSLTTCLFAQETMHDFGSVNFGDSAATIKEAEKNSKLIFEKDEHIIFEEESDGTKAQNIYEFNNNKLEVGMINIITEHKSLGECVEEYKKLDEMFKQVYGEPTEQSINVQDDSILSDNEKLAQAVKNGTASFATVWSKENFTITHTLIDTFPTEDFDEETQKVLVVAPLCHMFIGSLNSTEDEQTEEGENSDEGTEEGSSGASETSAE